MFNKDETSTNIIGDIQNLPFRNGVFNKIVCKDVMEHLPNPYKGLKEMNRVLKDGLIILTFPNVYELMKTISVLRNPYKKRNVGTRHNQIWDIVTMEELCDQLGLSIYKVDWADNKRWYRREYNNIRMKIIDNLFRILLPKSLYSRTIIFFLYKKTS